MTSPVRSMTGFGAARRESGALVATVEVRSVNNRHLTVNVRAPAALEPRSAEIEARVRARLSRGSVSVNITLPAAASGPTSRVATAILQEHLRSLAEAGLPTGPEVVAALLRLPGSMEPAPPTVLGEADAALVLEALDAALADLVSMRAREGAALATELAAGANDIDRLAGEIAARSPETVRVAHERLRERVTQLLGDGAAVPADALAREVAMLADRSDVAEEVARLRSHVAQWHAALADGGAIGRRLDFLAQEMLREANTIGSKANDSEIARAVIELKVAVERLKEQSANVE